MRELVGKDCRCVFTLEHHLWPVAGYPAWVTVIAVDMPMIKMEATHGGAPFWINAATIERIEAL